MADSEDENEHDNKTGTTSKACQTIVLMLLAPIALTLLLAWIMLGFWLGELSLPMQMLCSVGVALALCGWELSADGSPALAPYNFDASLLDLQLSTVAVALVLLALPAFSRNNQIPGLVWYRSSTQSSLTKAFATVLSIGLCALALAKAAAIQERTTFSASVITHAILLSGTVVASSYSLWIPASHARLCATEQRLLQAQVQSPGLSLSVVAGLGTIEVPCQSQGDAGEVLVLVHGFASGNVFWMLNLDALAQHRRVLAVEWPGVGRSTREPFPARDQAVDAERYFVERLEQWRRQLGLDRMILCGHSMGAIISVAYWEAHPQHVSHLVLVSPVAMPAPPASVTGEEKEPQSLGRRAFNFLWRQHLTPMAFVRFFGPFGKRILHAALSRRLEWGPDSSPLCSGHLDLSDVLDYCYDNWCLRPSSDQAMATMLLPGAWAKRPLSSRLSPAAFEERARAVGDGDGDGDRFPLSLIYGEPGYDWMDSTAGRKVVALLRQSGVGVNASCARVPAAGHLVFLDNGPGFCEALLEAIGRTE